MMTKQYIPYLQLLALKKLNPKIKKILISQPAILAAVSECIFNVLRGNVKLSDKQKSKLDKHKKVLRILATKSVSKLKKRKILQQNGGGAFLPFLIPAALSLFQLLTS